MAFSANQEFENTVSALWARLGMGPPRFGEPGRIRLRVETVGLDLTDNGRGTLDIEGPAGRLSDDAVLQADQVGRILRSNLGLLVGNDAGVFLRRGLDGQAALAVRSSYAYRLARIDRLVTKIEDVVRLIEYYAGELKSANLAPARRPQPAAASFEPAMIFRP